ncbi:hypothetical protein CPB86DRAFT_868804 [Serendipita vermifera]|nr:hypothetical protein CPB86DRAFT_868804 [Serendipita vermifera]
MSSAPVDTNLRSSRKVFGYSRDAKRPIGPLNVTNDMTAWEIYNHKASEVDREMIKDWNDSLNNLLIFAALYSAILTAFIIESMRLLQEDPTETTRDILLSISNQLANNTASAFQRIEYETPEYAVVVNGLLFTSLSCSLTVALLAVLALQWVANYDMGLNTSSARKRALQRHVRWMGIERWKMGEIIASLPLLLFVSLFLFFIGIADWLWHLNRVISGIVVGGVGIGCLLYTVTNLISIIKLDAPFRTPVSKGLALLLRGATVWIRCLVLSFPSEVHKHNQGWRDIRWNRIGQIWGTIFSKLPILPRTFAKYEEQEVEEKEEAEMESLLWLANSIEVTSASREIFLSLIKAFMGLSPELWIREKMGIAPWKAIFMVLFKPYFGRDHGQLTEEESRIAVEICKAYSVIPSRITSPILQTVHYSITNKDSSLRLTQFIAEYRHSSCGPWRLVDAIDIACKSISSIEAKYFHFLLLEIQQAWSILTYQYRHTILYNLSHACAIPSGDAQVPFIISTRSLDVIFDLVGRTYHDLFGIPGVFGQGTPMDRYIDTVWRLMEEGEGKGLVDRIHRSIQQQILAQIEGIDFSMLSAVNKLSALLRPLSKIICSRPLALQDQERDRFIRALTRIYPNVKDDTIQDVIEETLLAGLQYSHARNDQPPDRFVGSIVAIDEYFIRHSAEPGHYSNIINYITSILAKRDPCKPGSSLQYNLTQVKDPNLALWLTRYCPKSWEFKALVHPDFSKWNDRVRSTLHFTWITRIDAVRSDLHNAFLRTIIIDGPARIRQPAVSILEYLETSTHPLEEKEWLQILSSPGLNNILECYHNGRYGHEGRVLIGASRFSWFNDMFALANGLEWVSRIGLNGYIHASAILQIIVDQIVFESAAADIDGPLECSYICLKTLRGITLGSPSDRNENIHIFVDVDGQKELCNLREALIWVLQNATEMRHNGAIPPLNSNPELLEFATLAIQRIRQLELACPGQLRSFEFIRNMPDEEWEVWSGKIKSMVMGINMGGLEPGPMLTRHRFVRDAEGICGSSCASS